VEARAWNQIGIHRRTLKEQLHEKIQVRGVLIAFLILLSYEYVLWIMLEV